MLRFFLNSELEEEIYLMQLEEFATHRQEN
jgi:hypothetical protein